MLKSIALLIFFNFSLILIFSQNKKIEKYDFEYYSANIEFNSCEKFEKYKVNLREKDFITYLEDLTQLVEELELTSKIKFYRDSLKLSDYLTYSLLENFIFHFRQNKNASTMIKCIVFEQLGYNVKLKYNKNKIYGLIETNENESCCFCGAYNENNKMYFAFDLFCANLSNEKIGSFKEYSLGENPGKLFSWIMKEIPLFKEEKVTKEFVSPINKEIIKVELNNTLIEVLLDHSPVDIETGEYMKPKNEELIKPVVDYFKQVFKEKAFTEIEKLNTMVEFVSLNFPYKSDRKNTKWTEKPLYPDEILFYKHGDCEDLSFVLAYLLKELTNFKILCLSSDVQQHVNIAVLINKVVGKPFKYRGFKYTVIDPSNYKTGYSVIGADYEIELNDYEVIWESEG